MSDLEHISGWISNGMDLNEEFLWTCPFCDNGATITKSNRFAEQNVVVENWDDDEHLCAISGFVTCPNSRCRERSLYLFLYPVERKAGHSPTRYLTNDKQAIDSWRLVPASEANVYPTYVPEPIRRDYTEAYLVRDISPKASATLARRCLQGMIRDYYGISKDRLSQEIEAIKDKVDPLTWRAIDAARHVGNIGAHMEKDINLIIQVEPEEAAALINLIEMQIQDWYINRHEREQQLESIIALEDQKRQTKGLFRRQQGSNS